MKLRTTLTVLTLSLATILGCEQSTSADSSSAPALPAADTAGQDQQVLVTVNGTPITTDMFAAYYQSKMQKQRGRNTPELQSQALNELINIMLLSQEAARQNLDQEPQVKSALDLQRAELLSKVALNRYAQNNAPDDEALKKLYDEKYGDGGSEREYHARHILVKTEQEATDLIEKLDDGDDFAELAKAHSTGPTGKNGGDLGWFGAGQMVKPFSDAVAALEPGSVTRTPVKTQFGWHVIRLEDSRIKPAPTFDEERAKLMRQQQGQVLGSYVSGLAENADIQINEALAKPPATADGE